MSLSLVPTSIRPPVATEMDAESSWGKVMLLALDAVSSPHTRRSYQAGLTSFFAWHRLEGLPEFERATVQRYRSHLEASSLSPSSINVYLSAIRKLATEASENGFLDREVASGIVRIKGVTQHGVRAGNWLTPEETSALLRAPDPNVLKGLRDRAILALLVGCALRRTELARLRVEHLALRDARWVLVDLVGKGKRVRTVTVPAWTKMLVDDWTARAGITEGRVFRAVNKGGRMWGEQITDDVVWAITREYGAKIGKAHLAPHDLRRTCAKLCRASGGALEQIQFLLGHSSVQTTERYLGTRQNLAQAVNDNLPIEVPGSRADECSRRTSDIPSKMPARSERGVPTLSIAVPDGLLHVRPERS